MASLRETLNEKSKALVKRKVITLPQTGVKVTVRTLMSGDMQRANAAAEQDRGSAMVAYAVEDPDNPGVPLYNWNLLPDRDEIATWHIDDMTAVVNAHNELMGIAAAENPPIAGRTSSTVSVPALVSSPES
jgi:hypothetical protein